MSFNNIKNAACLLGIVVLGVVAVVPGQSLAHSIEYIANLQPLNNSGVTGTALATHDEHNDTLQVTINATGLVPNQPHPQHIHGVVGGESNIPTLACCDPDRDGFIEVVEGAAAYGPILQNLTSPPGTAPSGFPTAPNGIINFSQTYDLNDPMTFAGVAPPLGVNNPNADLLFPLENRHVVIHGLNVPAGVGAGTPGEVDGTAGYKVVLPVANGEFVLVPEPSSVALLASGLVGAGWFLRRRKADEE